MQPGGPNQSASPSVAAHRQEELTSAQIQDRLRYGTLGSIVENVYRVLTRLSRDPLWLNDPVALRQVDSAEYFTSTRGVRPFPNLMMVRQEFLPHDSDVKAVYYYDNDRPTGRLPVVECTRVDMAKVSECLLELFGSAMEVKGRRIVHQEEGRRPTVLAVFKDFTGSLPEKRSLNLSLPREHFRVERTRIHLPLPVENLWGRNLALQVVEAVYQRNCFQPERESLLAELQSAQPMSMELKLELRQQQIIEQEQVPAIAIHAGLTAYRAQFGKVLKMNGAELQAYIRNQVG